MFIPQLAYSVKSVVNVKAAGDLATSVLNGLSQSFVTCLSVEMRVF